MEQHGEEMLYIYWYKYWRRWYVQDCRGYACKIIYVVFEDDLYTEHTPSWTKSHIYHVMQIIIIKYITTKEYLIALVEKATKCWAKIKQKVPEASLIKRKLWLIAARSDFCVHTSKKYNSESYDEKRINVFIYALSSKSVSEKTLAVCPVISSLYTMT